jgi:hypothetical protein
MAVSDRVFPLSGLATRPAGSGRDFSELSAKAVTYHSKAAAEKQPYQTRLPTWQRLESGVRLIGSWSANAGI